MEEVLIVGGGPCGLAAGVACQDAGLNPLVLEKGCLVYSIYQYPTYLTFFSTPELLEIGGMPFMTENDKPTRKEALNYYRLVAERKKLRIHTYEEVTEIRQEDGYFTVLSTTMHGDENRYEARHVIVATGYFDNPNRLGIPGEALPKVYHQFKEAHPFQGTKVAIIGGQNSAIDAAMELERIGAEVTIVYRGERLSDNVKPWVKPVFESLLHKGRVKMLWSSRVVEIRQRQVVIEQEGGPTYELDNDFVLKLIGYRPDRDFLAKIGVEVNEETTAPVFNPETMETGVPGIYVAGVIAAGREANEIFIENGRGHGLLIAQHILSRT
jgi:thioredoxin reductase (NADPH)